MKPSQHGCPDTDVLVRQEMPLRMCPCIVRDSGLVRSKSRKRSDAIEAIRKQPSVMTSKSDESCERILNSQAAKTARGIGDASHLSKGIRVCDLRQSETVWL